MVANQQITTTHRDQISGTLVTGLIQVAARMADDLEDGLTNLADLSLAVSVWLPESIASNSVQSRPG